MRKLIFAAFIAAILVIGCDYVPRTVYEIETTDGKTIKLLCPKIDPNRSTFTYIIDGECVVIE